MISCILLQNKDLSLINVKNLDEDNMYKKCCFKNNNNFKKIKIIESSEGLLEIWGKDKGLSNSINNNIILKQLQIELYGKCIIVLKNNEKYISLTTKNFFNILNIKDDILLNNNDNNNDNYNNNYNKNDIINIEKNEINKTNEDNEDNEENEEETGINYNKELTYDVYEYSDDE